MGFHPVFPFWASLGLITSKPSLFSPIHHHQRDGPLPSPRVLKLACFIHPLSTTARMVQIKVFHIPSPDGQHACTTRERTTSIVCAAPKAQPEKKLITQPQRPLGLHLAPQSSVPPVPSFKTCMPQGGGAASPANTDCVLCWAVEVC